MSKFVTNIPNGFEHFYKKELSPEKKTFNVTLKRLRAIEDYVNAGKTDEEKCNRFKEYEDKWKEIYKSINDLRSYLLTLPDGDENYSVDTGYSVEPSRKT